ncbi:hypothetical protein AB1Y20_000933 [Prymnesium parvum]|uniref:Uncharacterized protein n=1 Tax=Prymnesium parvum TaxID=97485 RepID=A0AB34K9L7_PRYPA|mmetsp:Transcript_37664/g.93642  ORF Transcript_37664/g.93642 Transcript_37664/m.93642 type:complete len:166 (-) Transcript_37664:463-960(-)
MLRVVLLCAVASVSGWTTNSLQGTGEASSDPTPVRPAPADAAAAQPAGAQLLAQAAPAEIVAGSPGQAAWSVDRLPVMHVTGGVSNGGEEGHLNQLVSLIAATSASVQASAWWVGVPVYWQAVLLVLGAVVVFGACLTCSYCLCLAATEREAKKRIARRAKMAHK